MPMATDAWERPALTASTHPRSSPPEGERPSGFRYAWATKSPGDCAPCRAANSGESWKMRASSASGIPETTARTKPSSPAGSGARSNSARQKRWTRPTAGSPATSWSAILLAASSAAASRTAPRVAPAARREPPRGQLARRRVPAQAVHEQRPDEIPVRGMRPVDRQRLRGDGDVVGEGREVHGRGARGIDGGALRRPSQAEAVDAGQLGRIERRPRRGDAVLAAGTSSRASATPPEGAQTGMAVSS